MDQILLVESLSKLPERLSAFDDRIGQYCGYVSTSKGITLKTLGCSLFLHRGFIYKLVQQPDKITEEDLTELISGLKRT